MMRQSGNDRLGADCFFVAAPLNPQVAETTGFDNAGVNPNT